MSYAAFRSGTKTHTRRPSAGERSARMAWDVLSQDGEIVSMKLIDGLWMAKRVDGSLNDVEASYIRNHVLGEGAGGEKGKSHAAFRSGTKTHTKRPSASERSARMAWDVLSQDGEIVSMELVEGLWMGKRVDGSLNNVEASDIRNHVLGDVARDGEGKIHD